MIAAGIDIGSLPTKALVFDNEKGIPGYSIIPTGGSLGTALLPVNGF